MRCLGNLSPIPGHTGARATCFPFWIVPGSHTPELFTAHVLQAQHRERTPVSLKQMMTEKAGQVLFWRGLGKHNRCGPRQSLAGRSRRREKSRDCRLGCIEQIHEVIGVCHTHSSSRGHQQEHFMAERAGNSSAGREHPEAYGTASALL